MGPVIAITCAFTWSLAVILLKIAGERLDPIVMNLGKNTLGLILALALSLGIERSLPSMSSHQLIIVLASGFIGIGIADAMVLKAMKSLPASRIAILECLYAPFIITLAVLFLDESPSWYDIIGGGAIFASLALVIPKSQYPSSRQRSETIKATLLMAGGIFTMAIGVLIIKPTLQQVPLLWVVSIRMFAGVIGSVLIWLWLPKKREKTLALFASAKPLLVFSSFFLSSCSILLWIAGYKYLQTSSAAILNQTSTIFTVILAFIILKERLSLKDLCSAILATLGAILVSYH